MILPRKEFKYMAKNQPMTPPAGDEIFLLKMGEMVLKGLNRRTFEERLMGNARRRLEKFGKFRIYSRQSITYIEPKTEDCDMDGAFETLTRLFGVVGLSRAKACEKTRRPFWRRPRPTSTTTSWRPGASRSSPSAPTNPSP